MSYDGDNPAMPLIGEATNEPVGRVDGEGNHSIIFSGSENEVYGCFTTVIGGRNHVIRGNHCLVLGGENIHEERDHALWVGGVDLTGCEDAEKVKETLKTYLASEALKGFFTGGPR